MSQRGFASEYFIAGQQLVHLSLQLRPDHLGGTRNTCETCAPQARHLANTYGFQLVQILAGQFALSIQSRLDCQLVPSGHRLSLNGLVGTQQHLSITCGTTGRNEHNESLVDYMTILSLCQLGQWLSVQIEDTA